MSGTTPSRRELETRLRQQGLSAEEAAETAAIMAGESSGDVLPAPKAELGNLSAEELARRRQWGERPRSLRPREEPDDGE